MAVSVVNGDRAVSIGRVFSRAWSVMGHNPLVAFGASFLFAALPGAVISYSMSGLTLDFRQRGVMAGLIGTGFIALVIGLVLRSLVQGMLVRATVADSEGGFASFGECLGAAMSRVLPLIAVSLLFSLAVGVGFLLLIVPGIMAAVAWAVVIPVTVEERTDIGDAFRRSADLTRGVRWKIFGLALIVLVVAWLFMAVMGVISVLIVGLPNIASNAFSATVLITNAFAATITTTFWSTMQTSLYVELRDWKDGPVTQALSEIFE